MNRPLVVGLTGGIASGKSTIGKLLRELGATVVDADEVARAVVQPGQSAYRKLVAAFGSAILADGDFPAGSEPPLDRKKLAARVFSDEDARRTLNQITHPEIAAESARRMQQAMAQGAAVIVYEAALLIENNIYQGMDGLLVVDIPEPLQLQRAVSRGGLSEAEAQARIRSQVSREARRAAATWIIDNQGSPESAREQLLLLWRELSAGRLPAAQKPG
ncbi:MAG: dephospho-CoA kinase [Myxococcales bacterium]|jgi:dephospho-CoA kinase|nr:dephospho-CoA kinase [Myxococcales bacterium]